MQYEVVVPGLLEGHLQYHIEPSEGCVLAVTGGRGCPQAVHHMAGVTPSAGEDNVL